MTTRDVTAQVTPEVTRKVTLWATVSPKVTPMITLPAGVTEANGITRYVAREKLATLSTVYKTPAWPA